MLSLRSPCDPDQELILCVIEENDTAYALVFAQYVGKASLHDYHGAAEMACSHTFLRCHGWHRRLDGVNGRIVRSRGILE